MAMIPVQILPSVLVRAGLFLAAFATLSPKALAAPAEQAGYQPQPMDLIRVQVYQEPDLDRELRVSKEHTITLPLVGTFDLSRCSLRDAELAITGAYAKDYLVNPQVNLTVVEYAQRTVNVLGAVNNPGAVPMPPEKEFSLLDAIARSGGFSRLANRSKVSLTRTLPSGDTENYSIDANHLMAGDSDHRFPVVSGDVIYVPESVL